MKKIWFLVISLTLALHYNIKAQSTRFAIFASPLISYFKTDLSRIEPNGSRLGINIGLMMDRFFAEHYAFTTGISLETMGGHLNYLQGKDEFRSTSDLTFLKPNTDVKYKLQYLHIPLALKLRTTEIGYMTYFAQLGLDPMINVKANADISSEGIKNTGVGKEIHPIYMGYHIGAGIEYKIIGNTALMIGLTYMNGFSDITYNSGNSTEKTVMHCFELRLGVIF
ncbi:MAG TPA: porin family protein [Bacteroidales bacterium]